MDKGTGMDISGNTQSILFLIMFDAAENVLPSCSANTLQEARLPAFPAISIFMQSSPNCSAPTVRDEDLRACAILPVLAVSPRAAAWSMPATCP